MTTRRALIAKTWTGCRICLIWLKFPIVAARWRWRSNFTDSEEQRSSDNGTRSLFPHSWFSADNELGALPHHLLPRDDRQHLLCCDVAGGGAGEAAGAGDVGAD